MNYLKQYIELNELDFDIDYEKLDFSKDIQNYSKYWYIIQGYKKLQENKISLEDFFSLGEIFSAKNIEKKDIFSPIWMLEKINYQENKMYILDKISYNILKSKTSEQNFKKTLQKQNSIIIIL